MREDRGRCGMKKTRKGGYICKTKSATNTEEGREGRELRKKKNVLICVSVCLTAVVLSLRISFSQHLQDLHLDPSLHREWPFALDHLRRDEKNENSSSQKLIGSPNGPPIGSSTGLPLRGLAKNLDWLGFL